MIAYTCADGVAQIRLNRPERLNAVNGELVAGLLAALHRAHSDQVRAVVLAGEGRSFCSGYDLKEPDRDETPLQTAARVQQIQDITRTIRALPAVVIAAVHGYALGAGAEFALGCDLVVADETAEFGFPEVSVGLSVTGGISTLLPALVGPLRAKELLLLGERIDAATAAAYGLVNRVVPAGTHVASALTWARIIAGRPALATALAKQAIDRGHGATLEQALAGEVDHALLTRAANETAVFGS